MQGLPLRPEREPGALRSRLPAGGSGGEMGVAVRHTTEGRKAGGLRESTGTGERSPSIRGTADLSVLETAHDCRHSVLTR